MDTLDGDSLLTGNLEPGAFPHAGTSYGADSIDAKCLSDVGMRRKEANSGCAALPR